MPVALPWPSLTVYCTVAAMPGCGSSALIRSQRWSMTATWRSAAEPLPGTGLASVTPSIQPCGS